MLEISLDKRLGALRLQAELTHPAEGVLALFGRSGSGKTSLINMLAGLLRPDRGRIILRGETLFDSAKGIDLPAHRRRIGYVFQESRLFPHLTVQDNLLYGQSRQQSAGDAPEPDAERKLYGGDFVRREVEHGQEPEV